MNYKMLLNLVAIPTLVGSMFSMMFMVNQVSASEALASTSPTSCDVPTTPPPQASLNHLTKPEILIASSVESPILDFSAAESDAAATLFGCDCPSCINALRQLRSRPLLGQGQGHCWSALQGQFSSQVIQEVLKTLDTEEQQ